ncbi:MAG TPA: hypothetical protein VFZ01_01140 [Geminicoccaceae bacterium]
MDRSSAYTQAVMLVGYAGFLGFWAFMSDKMNEYMSVLAGMSMAISLAIFVLYTVWHIVVGHRMLLMRGDALLRAGKDPGRYMETKQEYEEKIKDFHIQTFSHWNLALWLSIVPAVAAAMLLFGAFAYYLTAPLPWKDLLKALSG